jgi:hypothetical protein
MYGYAVEISNNKMGALLADGTLHDLQDGLDKPINDDQWHYLVVTFDRDGSCMYYVDCKVDNEISIKGYGDINTKDEFWFCRKPAVKYTCFDGIIDEARVSNVVRTAGWIKTSYNNVNDPLSFVTFGSEEHH